MTTNAEMEVRSNLATKQVELIMRANGHPIAAIGFDAEQAQLHAQAVLDARRIITHEAKPSLILPPSINGTPFRP
jgi:hypothetical protein